MARKTDEERIAYAATVRGYSCISVYRNTANPDYFNVWFIDSKRGYGHMHTIENVLRWIRRQGRANA